MYGNKRHVAAVSEDTSKLLPSVIWLCHIHFFFFFFAICSSGAAVVAELGWTCWIVEPWSPSASMAMRWRRSLLCSVWFLLLLAAGSLLLQLLQLQDYQQSQSPGQWCSAAAASLAQ